MNDNGTGSASVRELLYLGWTGHGNYGDELIAETWRLAIAPDVTLPLTRRDHLRRPAATLGIAARRSGRERMVLLGGGTVIGFDNWGRHVADALAVTGARHVVALGAGAAECSDTFAFGLQAPGWDRWARLPLIGLGVRGPLSADACAENGIPAGVSGDPALLYPELAHIDEADLRSGPSVPRPIGVAVGADPASRSDLRRVARSIDDLARRTGAEVLLFALAPTDVTACFELRALLSAPSSMHVFDGDVRATTVEIGRCLVMVSERLHGAVAAVSVGVPTVPLAYASKCDDFWMSVTGRRPDVHPPTSREQLDRAIVAAMDPEEHNRLIRSAAQLRGRLRTGVESLAAWRSGSSSTSDLRAAASDAIVSNASPVQP